MRQYLFALPTAALLLAACGKDSPADVREPLQRDVSWLQANAIPFRTAVPDGDFADLEPLGEMVGNARVVALGEATHGTREFFQMKHRILEYLVREKGFTHFAIEATWAEANQVNRWVHTGDGDPAALLSDLHFWTWNTQEVLDMILWMREYNQAVAPAERVSFLGFDMQFSGRAMEMVSEYVTSVGDFAALSSTVGPGYGCWRTWEQARNYPAAATNPELECATGVQSVYDLMLSRQEEYEAASSPEAYAKALRAARVPVQHEHLASRRWVDVEPHPRDRYMAENAEWLLDQAGPNARIVLWAHNLHVMDVEPYMGWHLRQTYGSDMVIAGFSFHEGSLNAYRMEQGAVTGPLEEIATHPVQETSFQHAFNQLASPRFFFDARPLVGASDASTNWLRGPLPFREIGSAYGPDRDDTHYFPHRLPDHFDIVIHFRESNPSALLPFVN